MSVPMDCDDTNWPLAIVVAEGKVTPRGFRQFLREWSCWLDRATPFALLQIFTCSEAAASFRERSGELGTWSLANSARIRSLVLAVATVVPTSTPAEACDPHRKSVVGVPTRYFTSSRAAVSWLEGSILAPAGLRIDGL